MNHFLWHGPMVPVRIGHSVGMAFKTPDQFGPSRKLKIISKFAFLCCFFHYLVLLYYLSLLPFTVNKDEYISNIRHFCSLADDAFSGITYRALHRLQAPTKAVLRLPAQLNALLVTLVH